MISFPTPSVPFVCFGFSPDFICGFCFPPDSQSLVVCFTLNLRLRDASPFTTPSKVLVHESHPIHQAFFSNRIFVPIRHSRSRSRSHSHHTRQPTFFGFLYILVFASHRLKRSSTSFHPTLHHFTSILLNRGKLVTFIGCPPHFLVFPWLLVLAHSSSTVDPQQSSCTLS